jgi:hypothetical protein
MSDSKTQFMFFHIERKTAVLRRMLLLGDLFTTAEYARPASLIYALDFMEEMGKTHPIHEPNTAARLREFLATQSREMSKQAWIPFYVFLGAGLTGLLVTILVLSGVTEFGGFGLWIVAGVASYAILTLCSMFVRWPFDRLVRAKVREIREDIMKLSADTAIWAAAQKGKA